ncbi:MAG: ABC transporter ATP-binding protein [Ilumatobacter sp.]|uniref:ABC transporter ATP-binding protein n=1 Tax=Ilumatobacter sp. TaxID=1967498 RepID=UPI0026174F92|nr:ABC transporter ATP-binding protein [Ilumatobacter sp.]MDJ0770446.1 ABC transporter ATP-binding protein [Ilumatobacter sp.]
MPEDVVVAVDGLTKRYGSATVVDGVSFDVRHGEVLGILGANGAGKTTSVECVQGLRLPDSGTIRVCGLDPIRGRNELTSRIGSQLQHAALPDRLRVEEAIALFTGPGSEPVDSILETWGLAHQRRTFFGALSGGQQQRLFVALALINRPEVVFLDELTQGLDPNARRVVWELIDRLRAEGTTIVLVTHFLDEAEALCDRVAVMRSGRITALDTPDALVAAHGGTAVVRFTRPDGVDDARLRRLPGLSDLMHSGGQVELHGDRPLIAHVGALLVEVGDIPDDLEVRQPTLSDALLTMIGEDE